MPSPMNSNPESSAANKKTRKHTNFSRRRSGDSNFYHSRLCTFLFFWNFWYDNRDFMLRSTLKSEENHKGKVLWQHIHELSPLFLFEKEMINNTCSQSIQRSGDERPNHLGCKLPWCSGQSRRWSASGSLQSSPAMWEERDTQKIVK